MELVRRVESIGEYFFKSPYIGVFPCHRIYLHGTDIYGITFELPAFRTQYDLRYWAQHYLFSLTHDSRVDFPQWRRDRIEEQAGLYAARENRPAVQEDYLYIAHFHGKIRHWIDTGKELK